MTRTVLQEQSDPCITRNTDSKKQKGEKKRTAAGGTGYGRTECVTGWTHTATGTRGKSMCVRGTRNLRGVPNVRGHSRGHEFVSVRVRGARGEENRCMTRTVYRTNCGLMTTTIEPVVLHGRSRHEFVSIRGRRTSDEKIFITRTVCRTIVLCWSLESDHNITRYTDSNSEKEENV